MKRWAFKLATCFAFATASCAALAQGTDMSHTPRDLAGVPRRQQCS